MESRNNNTQVEKRRFQLCEHPWLSLLAVMVTWVFSIVLSGILFLGLVGLSGDSPAVQFAQMMTYHILTVFILVPFVLHLPKGKRTFRQYLDDIGLSRVHLFIRLVLLGLSCYAILALSQVAASFVYRLSEGLPINGVFIRQVFDPSRDLPPSSPSLFISFPSIFEEMVFRGIVLTVFLGKYSERKSIIFSSIGFGPGRLGFHHGLVLRICIRQDAQPSSPDDRPLSGQRVYQHIGWLSPGQGIHRDSGFVWRDTFTRCCPGDPHDLVDQILHPKVAARE